MESPEQKARRKAHHEARIAAMTPQEMAEFKERRRTASRECARRKRDEYLPKKREWQAKEKAARAAVRKETMANLTLDRAERAKREAIEREAAEVMIPSEAAKLLGLSTRSFTQWLTDGRIPSTKSPTGRRLIKRSDVQAIIDSVRTEPKANMTKKLALVKKSNGFVVPDGFDLITTYEDLSEYTLSFAKKRIEFLLLVGSPGSGKSRQIKADLETKKCTWIDNHASPAGLYCAVYDAGNRPVVLDDVNHFLKSKIACSLLKALCQTETKRSVSWESPFKYLEEREVPRQYETQSPICLIANQWDAKDADMAAIQDRSLPVAFFPSAETIHERVIELGWCDDPEIIKFVGDHLGDIPQPSMREYYQAMRYRRMGTDWRKKLLNIWGLN